LNAVQHNEIHKITLGLWLYCHFNAPATDCTDMKKRILILSWILISTQSGLLAQDPVFSQFFAAPLQLNPAFAGAAFAPRLNTNYRNQLPGWPNAYASFAAAYEQWLPGMNSGLGLMVTGDNAGNGIYRGTTISGTYSYQVQVADRLFFRLGAEAGIIQKRINWNRLVFGDQLDAATGATGQNQSGESIPLQLTQSALDASAGLLIFSSKFHAGISLRHLNSPDIQFLGVNPNLYTGIPMRMTIHGGLDFKILTYNKNAPASFLSPNMMYVSQGGFHQINAGFYTGLSHFFGGAWFRHTIGNADAAILLGGVRYGVTRIGYSYDFTVSSLANAGGGGSHEISFGINLGDSRDLNQKRSKADLNNCFKMFR
jgi:type IX secretion system PorP/SprF family membrane protein